MKSLFSSRISKLNILMAFGIFCIPLSSIPVSASPQEVCTKTSSGQVVCGTPVQKPTDGSTSNSKDYPTQVATNQGVVFELKSCARQIHNTISCIFQLSTGTDMHLRIYVNNETKLVDNEGYEYPPSSVIALKKIASFNSTSETNLVKDVPYKVTINFGNIPDSVKYSTLLQIRVASNTLIGDWSPQFRGVPFINLDGSISEVPLAARHRNTSENTSPSSGSSTNGRKICLPIVGCIKQ